MTDLRAQPVVSLSDADWRLLLRRVAAGKCTPFLGAGADAGVLPMAADLARALADDYDYPLADAGNLARVAQYMAIEHDDFVPREELIERFASLPPPDFDDAGEPHRALADLDLPLYLTTNYDDFMERALLHVGRKPHVERCEWNRYLAEHHASELRRGAIRPTPDEPVVFHLHGSLDVPQSMVLTEDDYLDFLAAMARDSDLLPSPVFRAITATPLLFLGYGLEDWNFRVLIRGLMSSLEASLNYTSIAVQLAPEVHSERAKAYLDRYFDRIQKIKVHAYWGTARQFVAELRRRRERADA